MQSVPENDLERICPLGRDAFDLPYPVFTTIYFLAFIAGIAILLMNLLVGVAIDNVNGVESNAIIERLAMQAKLSLDFEFLLPNKGQGRVVATSETLYPNVDNSFIFDIVRDNGTLRRIAKKIVEKETHVSFTFNTGTSYREVSVIIIITHHFHLG